MSSWLAIVRKDLRLTRAHDLVSLIGIVIVESLLLYVAYRTHTGAATVLSVFLLGLHAFALPVYVYMSLGREWRKTSPLWLHLPQPGWMLLGSKFVCGLVQMLVSFVVTGLFTFWLLAVDNPNLTVLSRLGDPQVLRFDLQVAGWFTAAVFGFALYMAVWGGLISVVMRSVRNALGRWRWLIGLALVLLATWGMDGLQQSAIYDTLFHWGAWHITFTLPAHLFGRPGGPATVSPFTLYAGDLLFNLLLIVALFSVSAWLLDRRAEV